MHCPANATNSAMSGSRVAKAHVVLARICELKFHVCRSAALANATTSGSYGAKKSVRQPPQHLRQTLRVEIAQAQFGHLGQSTRPTVANAHAVLARLCGVSRRAHYTALPMPQTAPCPNGPELQRPTSCWRGSAGRDLTYAALPPLPTSQTAAPCHSSSLRLEKMRRLTLPLRLLCGGGLRSLCPPTRRVASGGVPTRI